MFLTHNTVKTERFTPEVAFKLKKCDRVNTFTESGWFFAYGWIGNSLIVKTHANSESEYNAMMNPKPYHSFY